MNQRLFRDRREAGRRLAEKLQTYSGRSDVVVLALPRGGVPVGYEVARAVGAPLDVFVVRKLGIPGHEELAMGAVATGGVRVLNEQAVTGLGIPDYVIDMVAAQEQRELERRERLYRGGRPPPDVRGKTVILVDDGLATGSTMLAAVAALRRQLPVRIVVAVPVAAPQTCAELGKKADEAICAATPEPFYAVGIWYEDFSQTSDEEVRALLVEAQYQTQDSESTARKQREQPVLVSDNPDAELADAVRERAVRGVTLRRAMQEAAMTTHIDERVVRITAQAEMLEGNLSMPDDPRGKVLFAHGSGSSRHSPRNRFVARVLNSAGIATLLLDLLTPDEEAVDMIAGDLRFDIPFLAKRLLGATLWVKNLPEVRERPIGYFGASTGAAAALVAAAERPEDVRAVVSRGGRPDLAGDALRRVRAATLLIVGGNDLPVIELNRAALQLLECEKEMVIVPGATHLFEEPGALDQVAVLARDWFVRHLVPATAAA